MKNVELKFMTITTILLLFSIGFMFIQQDEKLKNIEEKIDENNSFLGINWEVWQEIEDDLVSDSQYNFQVMRDLFTSQYNDSVTVENAGYINGSWCYWVNHSSVLNSYYFEDKMSYLVAFPMFDRIYLVEEI